MPTKPRTAQIEANRVKREQLKEIVGRLGEAATGAEIRQEAYKVGFGEVHNTMLVHVRNELWPSRVKRGSGRGPKTKTVLVVPPGVMPRCPQCACERSRVRQTSRLSEEMVKRQRTCRGCGHLWWAEEKGAWATDIRRLRAQLATEKGCSKCKRVLPINNFRNRNDDPDLRRSSCRECDNKYDVDKTQRDTLAAYGLTDVSLAALLEAQGHRCAICQRHESEIGPHWKVRKKQNNTQLVIDHDHKTGLFRGLLCPTCNLAIGNFRDDPALMLAAIAYLKQHSEGG